MNSNNSSSNYPQLRFSGFEGVWEEKRLGDIASRVNRRNRDLLESRVLTNSASEGVVDQKDYFDRSIAVRENTGNYHIVEVDDFVYNPRISSSAPVGPISINKVGRGIMSPLYTIFKFHKGYIPFFEQYFQTDIWHAYLKSIANFGARFDRMNITTDGFFNMPLLLPSISEQKKVASCLQTLDTLISEQKQKVKVLKNKKKGMMQQLFPNIGEATPELRFPGYSGEWKEERLGDIGSTYSGLSGKSKEDFYTGDSKFVTFMNVLSNVRIDTDILGNVNVNDGEHQNKVEHGDMLFNTSSETPEEVGFCAVFDKVVEENVYLNSFCFGYRFKDKENHRPVFLAYFFRSDYGRNLMRKLAQGITRYNLSKEYFNKAVVKFPSPAEQEKIVECLTTFDRIIDAEDNKVSILKTYKEGLLQQLFPQPTK